MYFNVYISELYRLFSSYFGSTGMSFVLPRFRFDTVSSVRLSEGCSVSFEGTWGTARYGHYNRGLPHVDVERAFVSIALSIWWLHIPSIQQLCAL